MNTLSRAITARFFPNSESYNAFRAHWSALINSGRKHELTAAHHLLYLALIGKDWRKAFTPLTNRRKLENGAFWGWKMFLAVYILHSKFNEQELLAPFDGLITPEILQDLRSFLPFVSPSSFQPGEFTKTSFPFEAYKEQTTTPAPTAETGNFND
jgi:hypothetical protein